jgi:hypothetical protein
VPEADAVEEALAFGIREATKAQRWEVVAQLATELTARRTARNAPNVIALPRTKRSEVPR